MYIDSRLIAGLCLWFASSAVAVPLVDTVIVDEFEWAQPDLFNGVTWSDMNAACPGGVCASGPLIGYSMDGWRWATVDEVNGLFNHFLAAAGVPTTDLLGPGADSYGSPDLASTWAPAFFNAGFRSNDITTVSEATWGWTRTVFAPSPGRAEMAALTDYSPGGFSRGDIAASNYNFPKQGTYPVVGGWFFRPAPVSAPSSLLSLFLGLLGVAAHRTSRARNR